MSMMACKITFLFLSTKCNLVKNLELKHLPQLKHPGYTFENRNYSKSRTPGTIGKIRD